MKVDPRFLTGDGPEIFTGSELALKGALEAEGGVHLLTGYPGSPIAGFFDAMTQIKELLNAKGIRAVMAHNEALATAQLNGSQVLGCRGIVCMKSVGVHVAADALALGNLAGAHPDGGAVVIYGDDPWSDSTQVAADSRYISKHLFIPVIEPANPQEVKDYIDLALNISRRSELYSGYILPTNLADGGGSVQCRPNQYPAFNTRQRKTFDTNAIDLDKFVLLPPKTWWQEASLDARHGRAIRSARELGLNRIEYPSSSRKPIGFVTSGMAHGYLIQTLLELALLGELPVLKFGMTYPLDADLVRELADQCEQIVVVEERRGFLEEQISAVILQDRQAGRPAGKVQVWGKTFPRGLEPLPTIRGLHPSIIASRIVPLLQSTEGLQFTMPAGQGVLAREIETIDATGEAEIGQLLARVPSFCPGCPHRDSSALCLEIKQRFMDADYMRRKHKHEPVDLVFHGDIGCYTMLMFPPNTPLMHNLSGMGLGAGTGSGMDPFITNKQVVFMGDSTFFHSGQLAISNAIKLGQDITFIILDNSTTAMTGHQPTPGVDYDILGNRTATQDIEDVVQGIAGGADVFIACADPEKKPQYRDLLEGAFLADGVKIIIADKECGITRQRRKRRQENDILRRSGYLPTWEHMNVNQEVCRFCLACAEYTGCPGLKHVRTDYGLKMDTDISWCINDGACERIGACSAFESVTIKRKRPPRSRLPELGLDSVPEPAKRPPGDLWRCCLVGVGTQGIGTATSILVRAGHKEGYDVIFLDKKGLAIRGGGVVSQVVYNISKQPITALIPYGKADLLIGIDVLEAARTIDPRGRARIASREKTAAVINTDKFPTIGGIMGTEDFDVDELERTIRTHTRAEDYLARNISVICEKYLGGKIYANIMMLGFAFQKGLIPVSMHSMAWAIKDTIRTHFRKNLYAFNMGRKLVEQRDLFQGPPQRTAWRDTLEEKCRNTIRRYRRGQGLADRLRQLAADTIDTAAELDEPLKRDLAVRLYDCMRWGGIDYAKRYADAVLAVVAKDRAEYDFQATRAVIHNLASAMLIKDGIFIAELATSPEKRHRDRQKYNVNPANGDRIVYRHLIQVDWKWGPWRIQRRLALPSLTMRVLKRMRYLRKVLPRWHARERRFLAQYEGRVAAFAFADRAEYDRRVAMLGSPQCMDCANPLCTDTGCPLENDIPQWIQLACDGQWREAALLIHETNNFPEFTAQVCPAPCQTACKRGLNGYPVQVKQIEREIVRRGFEAGWIEPQRPAEKSGKKVAIVGSGPAGLAAAQQLTRAGHGVTVFERDEAPGGLLRLGIPDFRLDKDLLDRRLEQIAAEGVVFTTGVEVGKDLPADQLTEQFDAVLLATGAVKPRDLDVPGRKKKGIHFALDYLRQENRRSAGQYVSDAQTVHAKGKTVVVLGGGETGSDCVETALAQGAVKVHQLEILAESGTHNDPTHRKPAEVERRFCVATREFLGQGYVEQLSAAHVRWMQTANGPRMVEVPGSQFKLSADMVVLALGYEAEIPQTLAAQFGLECDDGGRLTLRDFATSADGVFAAGDAATGPGLVATAIHTGRKAAEKIHEYLAR